MTKEDVIDSQDCQEENEEVSERRVTNMEEAQARYDENVEIMRSNWPKIYDQIKGYKPESKLVFLDNGEPDLVFKGIYLYNEVGAYSYAREQVDKYWNRPHKLFSNEAHADTLDKHGRAALVSSLEKMGSSIKFNPQPMMREQKKSYYLYFLGIGLGVHLQEMAETTEAKVLLLLESNFDFFYNSMYVCDWSSFFKSATDRDVKIEFLQSSDAQQIANTFGAVIRQYNPAAVDGTILFQHYPSSAYQNAYDIFVKKVFKMVLMGLGFFEDELHMISHSYENLSRGTARTMRRIDDKTLSLMPVIIIANGPSLDANFEYLRKIQDHAIIISCGTAIDAVLSEGIHPDIQIHMERTRSNLQLYQYTAKNHDLSQVCLVSSTTACPGISDLFGETVYFFRPGLSPMPIFSNDEQDRLVNPDPTVANAGLSVALHLGFKDIYFFGVDAGAKTAGHHHSKSSLYDSKDDELPSYMDSDKTPTMPDSFKIEVPGNFGGTVLTNDVLLWTKNNLEGSINHHNVGRFFHNCSDGALIEGAVPLLPQRVRIEETSINKRDVLRHAIEKLPIYDRETFDAKWAAADLYNRLEEVADGLVATLDECPNLEDLGYSKLMMKYLKPLRTDDAVAMIYRGTLLLYKIAMHYYLNRAHTQEMLEKVREIYREDLIKLIYTMRDEAIAYYKRAERREIDYAAGDE